MVAHRRAQRRRQDDAGEPGAAVLRRDRRRASSIDGVDIRDVTLASLRAQIGIVTQETILFDDTRRAATSPTAAPTRRRARDRGGGARRARARVHRRPCPQGYDTFIGERGQRLSGGQRQRLAIARALLKNSPILILDEATSSLDTESELLVQDALANLMKNRTSFVIAHRLSTIRRADAIIVMDRGRIVEIGRHDELLARGELVRPPLRAAAARRPARPCRVASRADGATSTAWRAHGQTDDQEHDGVCVPDARGRSRGASA